MFFKEYSYCFPRASLVAQLVKNPPAVQETLVQSLVWEDPLKRDRLPTPVFLGFPGGSDGKESACNAGDLGSIPGLERFPRGGHGHPLQYSCLENPHGQRSLVGYSPWSHKELDTTERLLTAEHNILFPLVAASVYVPTNSVGGFPFLHTSPECIAVNFFDHGHSDWCDVIPHCNFDLHFPNN